MDTNNENAPATNADLEAIFNSEEFKKIEHLAAEVEKQMEAMNLVPLNKGGEQYIRDRYPIAALYARADLQVIATDDFGTELTEMEIQAVSDEFFCAYPDEMPLAVTAAVERVIKNRKS